jgi:uncharacterized protein involved in exopolysaccharide biosynthesis
MPTSDASNGDDLRVTPAQVLAILVRYPRLVLGLPIGLAVAGVGYVLLLGSFLATSSFTPEAGGGVASLAGLAAQFGVNVPGGLMGDARSVDFYATVLQSPATLSRVASANYTFVRSPGDTDTLSGTLYELYGITGDTPEEQRWSMVKLLQTKVSVDVDRLASIVTIKTKARWPSLAQQINRQLLDLVNELNTQQRQSQASAQRRFIQDRLTAAQEDLVAAERDMQDFLERNRQYQASPKLTFDAARLQRRIELRQQVFLTLSQSFEQASIEEVRDTPVITVLQDPELVYKRARNPVVIALGAIAFGTTVGVTMAFLLAYLAASGLYDSPAFASLRKRLPILGRL